MSVPRNHRSNRRLVQGALATVLAGLGLTACRPAVLMGQAPGDPVGITLSQTQSQSQPRAQAARSGSASAEARVAPVGGGTRDTEGWARDGRLRAMPSGWVALKRDDGYLAARIDLFGLTPGSSHTVAVEAPGGSVLAPAVRFGTFTADATGQVHTTLTAREYGSLPAGSRFSIHLGTFSGEFDRSSLAMELIARTAPLPTRFEGLRRLPLHAVSYDVNGENLGPLYGHEKITYDPAAHALTVTVTAHGLTPGAHAAHIHQGSCQTQGGVKYMIPDFQADSRGDILDETRTITDVTEAPPAGGWYLNLHLGDSHSILSNGAPSLSFRPMLCADLGPVPVLSGGQATATPTLPAVPSAGSQGPTAQSSSTGTWTPVAHPGAGYGGTGAAGSGIPSEGSGPGQVPVVGGAGTHW